MSGEAAHGRPAVITGRTRVIAHVAHPSAHVRAPQFFNAACARRGLDAVMVSVDVAPGDLGAMLDSFRSWRNLAGIGVTVPHKEAVIALVDELGPQAALVGAANAIRRDPDGRLIAEMYDGTGMVEGLRGAGHELAGRRVLLVGAGGAARAIAFAVAGEGAAAVTIANRTAARAEALAESVRAAYADVDVRAADPDPSGCDVVINATTLGMHDGDPLPVDLEALRPPTLVAEVVMSPPETALLLGAARAGCPTHGGAAMLEAQIDLNLRHFAVLA